MSNLFDKNYYELFNVSEDASDIEIKRAYARLVRQYTNETHPEEFMHIRKAFQVLSNPSERAAYDRMIHPDYSNSNDENYQEYSSNNYSSYSDSYSDNQSYNNQDSYYSDNTYNQYDSYSQNDTSYNDYNSSYNDNDSYNSQQYDYGQYNSYQNDYESYSQSNNYGSSTYTEEAPRNNYSLFGNIIFSIIVSLLFTPIVGIITGIVIHVFKIPVMKIVGCIFWIIVALIILGFLIDMM